MVKGGQECAAVAARPAATSAEAYERFVAQAKAVVAPAAAAARDEQDRAPAAAASGRELAAQAVVPRLHRAWERS